MHTQRFNEFLDQVVIPRDTIITVERSIKNKLPQPVDRDTMTVDDALQSGALKSHRGTITVAARIADPSAFEAEHGVTLADNGATFVGDHQLWTVIDRND